MGTALNSNSPLAPVLGVVNDPADGTEDGGAHGDGEQKQAAKERDMGEAHAVSKVLNVEWAEAGSGSRRPLRVGWTAEGGRPHADSATVRNPQNSASSKRSSDGGRRRSTDGMEGVKVGSAVNRAQL